MRLSDKTDFQCLVYTSLLMSVLISAFMLAIIGGSLTLLPCRRSNPLADTNPEEARPLLDRLRDSLSLFDEEQHMYYDLLDLKVNDKMYVRHTSDSLIKRITAFYETYGDRDKLLESYYYMGVYRDLNDAPEALKYFQKALMWRGYEKVPIIVQCLFADGYALFLSKCV